MNQEIDCLGAAIELARDFGWGVFPVGGKHPIKGTHGHLDASNSVRDIKKWWKQYPTANLGIACNSEIGPIVVDVDAPEGIEILSGLNLPETMTASSRPRTYRRHFYFAPGNGPVSRAIKLFPGVDILGDGGYVVAPPSIHPKTGKPYRWLNNLDPVALPDSLLRAIRKNADKKNGGSAPPLPDVIMEGKRDELLTSLAGSMRRRGASEESIIAALREENERKCRPPLDDRQLRKIARSIAQKTPVSTPENLTDLGNARRFISLYGVDLKHVRVWRRPWIIWEGDKWTPDETGEVERMAKRTIGQLYVEANQLEDEKMRDSILKHAMRSETSNRIKSLLELASTEPEIATTGEIFDRDPWLFNVENGTIDLRTGEFRAHSREDHLTKVSGTYYDPKAKAPVWTRFLNDITRGDKELIRYLQRAAGYSLTADVREQCLFFCYGTGQNGKSTFLEILREVMGPYAQQADFSTFLAKKSDGPRNDLARMRGIRLVTAIEASSDRSFDEGVLKQLTGGDTVTARRLYEEYFEFQPTHKIFLAANHKPHVADQTEAFWRRIKLIPFTVTIPTKKRDNELKDKIREELPGVLNWALRGCSAWQKSSLGSPPVIVSATESYRDEEDLTGEFLAQCCEYREQSWTSASTLYQNFVAWWRETRGLHSKPPSMRWFNRSMGEKPELSLLKRKNNRGWKGISVKVRLV